MLYAMIEHDDQRTLYRLHKANLAHSKLFQQMKLRQNRIFGNMINSKLLFAQRMQSTDKCLTPKAGYEHLLF